ncbi:MAG: PKD domain-containing protein, partial [Bacteroidetes bacterium]
PGNFTPFPGNATTICAGSPVTWSTNLSPASSYTFAWSTGETTSTININSAGQYSVMVTDMLGCTRTSSTVTVSIDNYSQPGVVSLGSDITMCAGNSIALTSGAGQATSYLWSTGSTASSIVINTTGMNSYSVEVQNANGCTAKDTILVNVKGMNPIPNFSTVPACLGSASTFTDGSTAFTPDSVLSWSWNFGDATSTSSVANPTHTYTAAGSYTISLTVSTDSGCSASVQKIENVFDKPIAGFSYNTITPSPCSGLSVSFVDGSSISTGGLNTWNWNFGDGSPTDTVKNPAHTYSVAGNYSVQMIVWSQMGCADTVTSVVTVFPSPFPTLSADTACKGYPTSFSGQSSGTVVGWTWNFGDGTNSTIQNPLHTYTLAAVYSVTLSVSASNGCVGLSIGTVLVNHLPRPGFAGDSVCVNAGIQFTDTSKVTGSTITGWNWQFGNGDSSLIQHPAVTYTASGIYTVTLTTTSAQGCFTAVTQSVTAMPLPVSGFSFTPGYSYPQQPVNFTDLSSGAINYHWYFGDGGEDLTQNPVHTYMGTGTFTITLVVQSAFGCIDSFVQQIPVDIPVLDVGINDMLAVNSSGIIQVSAFLENKGTLDITTIELSAYLDDGTPVHEFWTGFAGPKDSVPYFFKSSFEMVNNKHSIVCVEVKKVNGQQDYVFSNNIKCVAITDEFTLLNPFPNPTNGEVYFFFVAPDASHVKAEVLDARGRVIATPFDGRASKGLNQVPYNTVKLEKGMYWVKLSYGDKVSTKVFVKE